MVALARYVTAMTCRVYPPGRQQRSKGFAVARSRVRASLGASPTGLAESSSLALRTGRSSQVALHLSSRKRSYHFRLQAGNVSLRGTSTLLIKRLHRRTSRVGLPRARVAFVFSLRTLSVPSHRVPNRLAAISSGNHARPFGASSPVARSGRAGVSRYRDVKEQGVARGKEAGFSSQYEIFDIRCAYRRERNTSDASLVGEVVLWRRVLVDAERGGVLLGQLPGLLCRKWEASEWGRRIGQRRAGSAKFGRWGRGP